ERLSDRDHVRFERGGNAERHAGLVVELHFERAGGAVPQVGCDVTARTVFEQIKREPGQEVAGRLVLHSAISSRATALSWTWSSASRRRSRACSSETPTVRAMVAVSMPFTYARLTT